MIPSLLQLVADGWNVEIGPHSKYGPPGFYCVIFPKDSDGPGDECEECDHVARDYDDAEHGKTVDEAYANAYARFVNPS